MQQRYRRSAAVIAAIVVAGCGEHGLTAPTTPPDGLSAPSGLTTSAARIADVRNALDDATSRLLPSMAVRDGALALHVALHRLKASLDTNDIRFIAVALEDAVSTIAFIETKVGTTGPGTPDLAAIGLALQAAAHLRPHGAVPGR